MPGITLGYSLLTENSLATNVAERVQLRRSNAGDSGCVGRCRMMGRLLKIGRIAMYWRWRHGGGRGRA